MKAMAAPAFSSKALGALLAVVYVACLPLLLPTAVIAMLVLYVQPTTVSSLDGDREPAEAEERSKSQRVSHKCTSSGRGGPRLSKWAGHHAHIATLLTRFQAPLSPRSTGGTIAPGSCALSAQGCDSADDNPAGAEEDKRLTVREAAVSTGAMSGLRCTLVCGTHRWAALHHPTSRRAVTGGAVALGAWAQQLPHRPADRQGRLR